MNPLLYDKEELISRIELLERIIVAYDSAAKKFIEKVDSGRARSVETYNELKSCYTRQVVR